MEEIEKVEYRQDVLKNSEKILCVGVAATRSYLYAWRSCIRRITAAVAHWDSGHFIFACDKSKECKDAAEFVKHELPENWKIHVIAHDMPDDTSQNYKTEAQFRIATLDTSLIHMSRKLKADLLWLVESDVLVNADSLRLNEWVLNMPDGYYDISMGTYPNGSFLGGRGDYQHVISEDWKKEEKKLPKRLLGILKNSEKRLKQYHIIIPKNEEEFKKYKYLIDKEQKRLGRLHEKIKNSPPIYGIWETIAKFGWRKRGWLEHAYPSIGRGAILPSDWVGFGNTLLSKKALSLVNFDNYPPDCSSTQDLHAVRHCWRPNGIRMCVVTHSPCSHVKPDISEDKKRLGTYHILYAYWEPEGEYENHLRVTKKPWIQI